MLRKRIITSLTFVEDVLFRSKEFDPDYRFTHNFVDAWAVDEIVLLDITRDKTAVRPSFLRIVESFAARCFVPLTAGGGVRKREDVRALLDAGADKMTLNTGAVDRPELIGEIAQAYGAQCTVVSIDARRTGEGGYEVFTDCGRRGTGETPVDWARRAVAAGAGEILVSSIERDGSLTGYELPLMRAVADAVDVPVVASAGCGNWKHLTAVFREAHVDGACLTNIYHFTETSIQAAKRTLDRNDVSVRIDPAPPPQEGDPQTPW